ncbi:hypothetical protein ALO46_102856 [Pseudomonas syringae pv. solidagae]|nr:hypothetical protein ALO46_102856 [Pseudomonas syringae pv. solidagae]
MLILDRILGQASDPALADRLHDLSHAGQVETLSLSGSDIQRHRLRLASDRGTDCAIRLERHQHLRNGSVLLKTLVSPSRASSCSIRSRLGRWSSMIRMRKSPVMWAPVNTGPGGQETPAPGWV